MFISVTNCDVRFLRFLSNFFVSIKYFVSFIIIRSRFFAKSYVDAVIELKWSDGDKMYETHFKHNSKFIFVKGKCELLSEQAFKKIKMANQRRKYPNIFEYYSSY